MDCDLRGLCLPLGTTYLPRESSAVLGTGIPGLEGGNSTQLLRHSHGSLKLVLITVS